MKRALLILSCAGSLLTAGAQTNSNRLTLTQCLAETLAHNEQLQILRKDVERASGTKLEIRSRDLPQLTAQVEAGGRTGDLYGSTGPYALFTAQFSQRVFDAGIAASWHRGESEVVAAEQRLNLAVSDRLHEARYYYLRAQRLAELIRIDEDINQRLTNNLAGEQQRKNVGTTGPRPVLQAKIQLLASQAELTSFQREAFEVRTLLAGVMQRPVDQLPQAAEPLTQAKVTVDWREQERLALQRRADLKFLRALIQITKEDRQMVDAGYFPFISLVGSELYLPDHKLVYQATPIIEGQTPLGTEGRIGGLLTWQIVDNGQVTGVSRRVASIQHEYEISLRQLEQNIPRALTQIFRSLEDANARLAALQKSLNEAQEDLQLIETRISLGEATQLDFSDAQRNLLAVRHGIVDSIFQYDRALGELDWVTGRYLEFAEPARQP